MTLMVTNIRVQSPDTSEIHLYAKIKEKSMNYVSRFKK